MYDVNILDGEDELSEGIKETPDRTHLQHVHTWLQPAIHHM